MTVQIPLFLHQYTQLQDTETNNSKDSQHSQLTIDTKHSKDSITIKNIKYIILDHYGTEPNSKYKLELLTERRKSNIIKRKNKQNTSYDYAKGYKVRVTELLCWECGHPIFVYNPIVSNTLSKGKKRYYHFLCARKLKLVIEVKEMHRDYNNFLLGLIL